MEHFGSHDRQENLVWWPCFVVAADELSYLHWHHKAAHFRSQSQRGLATGQPHVFWFIETKYLMSDYFTDDRNPS